MRPLAARWYEKYLAEYDLYVEAATEVERQVRDALAGGPFSIQLIETRAKHPDSVREKILRNNYRSPALRFDDLIGARVITLFDHTVVDVEDQIRSRFRVHDERSSNKSDTLGIRQVGYRSNHMIISAQRSGLGKVADVLQRTRVELQIRSVISHAWAEIEHSLRYKVGSGVPKELARRFDALAGTLELVDREFSAISTETVRLINARADRYSAGQDLDDELSSVQLLAALKSKRPHAPALGADDLPLGIEDAYRYSRILRDCGVDHVRGFLDALDGWEVRDAILKYSDISHHPVDPTHASAIVVIGAVVGTKDPDLFLEVKAFADPLLREALHLPATLGDHHLSSHP